MVTQADKLYMRRAFELALAGRGRVSPNPLVGCVIVGADGQVIGEGWHRKYGEAHAEVNAINAVKDKERLKDATMYVTLEPCAHTGKTPSCARLIRQYPFKKVYIANTDPNPLVDGQGIELLKDAGVGVQTGVLEDLGYRVNARFFTYMKRRRPYIILKWAETADGFIAREDFSSKWISGRLSRILVHKWRTEEDAVMVGGRTAHYDNPALNARDWTGRNPVRIVIDRGLRLSPALALFDQTQKTLCYNEIRSEEDGNIIFIKLDKSGGLEDLIEDLYRKNIQSVLVEGGATLLNTFLNLGLWDEIRRFRSEEVYFGSGIAAPRCSDAPDESIQVRSDRLDIILNRRLL